MKFTITYILAGLITIALITNGCKKDDPFKDLDLKGIYYGSSTQNLSGIMMYTVSGQVTDQDVIQAYLNKYKSTTSQLFFQSPVLIQADQAQLNFQDNGIVIASDSANEFSAKFTVIQKSSSGFVLSAVDTSETFEGSTNTGSSETRADKLITNSSTLNKLSNCQGAPAQTGFTQSCTYRNAYQFTIKNKQIYFATLSCSISCYSKYGGSYSSFSGLDGYFNTGLLKQLITGDTLVYQTHATLFSK